MNIKKSLTVISALIIAVIFISACSPIQTTSAVNNNSQQPLGQNPTSGSSSAVSSTKEDACTLLPKDDVSKVLGATVVSAEVSGLGRVCTYKTANLRIDFTMSKTGGTKAMNTTLANLGDLALVVPGLGDLAFYNTNAASGLFVLKGDAEYLFSMGDLNYQPLDPANVQATEKALAEQLLSNLP